MYFPECFAMNAGISAMYFLKPPKSFTDRSSTKYAFIPYLAHQHQLVGRIGAEGVIRRFKSVLRLHSRRSFGIGRRIAQGASALEPANGGLRLPLNPPYALASPL